MSSEVVSFLHEQERAVSEMGGAIKVDYRQSVIYPPENGQLFTKKKEKHLLIFDCKPSSIFPIDIVVLHFEAPNRCRSRCVIAIGMYIWNDFLQHSVVEESHEHGKTKQKKSIAKERENGTLSFSISTRFYNEFSHTHTRKTMENFTGNRLSATHFSTGKSMDIRWQRQP